MRVNSGYTEDELIAGIKKKDNEIIKFIIKDNFKKIRQFVQLNNGSESDAQDLFQESIIVVYRKVQSNNFKLTSTLGTYLYAVAKLLWLKELNKRGKGNLLNDNLEFLIDDKADIQEAINKNERLNLFREKYDELTEDCKKVLRMFLLEVPIKEITNIMGYSSEQHTRNRRYRCKESLIKRILESRKFKELGYGKHPVD